MKFLDIFTYLISLIILNLILGILISSGICLYDKDLLLTCLQQF